MYWDGGDQALEKESNKIDRGRTDIIVNETFYFKKKKMRARVREQIKGTEHLNLTNKVDCHVYLQIAHI